jgi:hypothetical protein
MITKTNAGACFQGERCMMFKGWPADISRFMPVMISPVRIRRAQASNAGDLLAQHWFLQAKHQACASRY